MKRYTYTLLLLLLSMKAMSQTCTARGQNPSTAFPVCGTDTFSQANVPLCGGRTVPGPCSTDPLTDVNPFWYKFTCFTGGTLGFLITPNNFSDDYDWQLFDVTGKNPDDVYTDASLFVACNWSGEGGLTGASNAGTSLQVCAGLGKPLFSRMPVLVQGHDYILLISHFTNSQSGYKLAFTGGTASITDPKTPQLLNARAACNGQSIILKLNKKMKCNSLAANGSDFRISPATGSINGAVGGGCSTGFDTDSVILSLTAPLTPGNYFLVAQKGSDGNTMLDYCDRNITEGEQVPMAVLPLAPTPMDSLTKVTCAPTELQLVFKKPLLCSSISADGSDFVISGSRPVAITGATGVCNGNGTTTIVRVALAGPVQTAGNFLLTLVRGADGNTLLDECGQETPQGSSLPFITKDTVSARFNFNISLGCKTDTVQFFHDGRNGVNQWSWLFDGSQVSTQQNPIRYYTVFGNKTAQLAVSNGLCADSANVAFVLDNELKAGFISTDVICPNDTTTFVDTSIGKIVAWQWSFGNGNSSNVKVPPAQFYPLIDVEKRYPVRLIVTNDLGCKDTLTKNIIAVANCYIAVPTAFTPNGDGLNDFLYPLNAYKADRLEFRVYNRLGQLIWQTKDWTRKWDGRLNGDPLPTQALVWTLTYVNRDTGIPVSLKGTTTLIR